ncbi:MAG: carbamoyltransferase HypF [Desulfovibrio sp.]|nr:carbamoyltransferase HypF [Desulfovibrio sp.]
MDRQGIADELRRLRLTVRGQVQGVGFRPFVFLLAEQCALTGFVRNGPEGVRIEVQGREEALRAFALGLERNLPPLARITGIDREYLPPKPEETSFDIAGSSGGRGRSVLVSPDVGICPQCLAEIRDRANRRYRHPFANCTDCGPRYSLTRTIPYDRSGTSMACFPLCPECRAEYENPRDRRFHAQPNACPQCGPVVRLELPGGAGERARPVVTQDVARELPADAGEHERPVVKQNVARELTSDAGDGVRIDGERALPALARFLFDGGIAAVKGIGGFHLACDARNDRTVAELRRRKLRPRQALAVTAAGLGDIRRIAALGSAEEAALLSPERPIVICPLLPRAEFPETAVQGMLSESGTPAECFESGTQAAFPEAGASGGIAPAVSSLVAPDTRGIGVMLPYTPLHVLLMDEFAALSRREGRSGPAVLVMTSGNRRGEPICLGNREARASLAGIADAFLFHNRDILVRVDDSVVRPRPARDGRQPGLLFFRRARGFVPRPINFAASLSSLYDSLPCVFGAGAELKNAPCLTRGTEAFAGQHVGDMEDPGTAAFHEEVRDHLMRLLHVEPEIVVRDAHPDALSGRLAEEYAGRFALPVLRLQHHFAHAHAVLAENGHAGKALVLVLDGSGFGPDGTLWGGELLFVEPCPAGGGPPVHKRAARMAPLDLPGGDAAVREPWRIAHALLLRLGLIDERGSAPFPLPWLPEKSFAAGMLRQMLESGLNTPRSSGCGRLFDAVSALLGLCLETSYEGQAAICLEEAQALPPFCREAPPPDSVLYPCPLLPDPEVDSNIDSRLNADAEVPLDAEPGSSLDTRALFRALCEDLASGTSPALIARRFHSSLAGGLVEAAAVQAAALGVKTAALSGGCMMNMTLSGLLRRGLEEKGLTVLEHVLLPPGDGCIGFGQAVYGALVSRCSS